MTQHKPESTHTVVFDGDCRHCDHHVEIGLPTEGYINQPAVRARCSQCRTTNHLEQKQ